MRDEAGPTLTVAIPTYNRPDLLERALRSVTRPLRRADEVEIVVSDNSTEDASEVLVERLLANWPGPTRYVRNRPGVGAEPNFNRCRELANGRYVLILHDDDYLLDGACSAILDAIDSAAPHHRVLLFGVRVVDEHERTLRRREFEADVYLSPEQALERVLSNSSFVRFPAIVVHRDAYEQAGDFRAELKNPVDFDMWIRLFGRFGVRCLPTTTCAYTVHQGALTSEMFNETTIDRLLGIFDRVQAEAVVDPADLRRYRASFFHQFVLAAAWRRLRTGDLAGARRVMDLLRHPRLRGMGLPARWAAVRLAFWAATRVARDRTAAS